MNGLEAGTISQVLNLVVGQQYELTFALSGNPDSTRGLKILEVSWGARARTAWARLRITLPS